MFEIITEQNHEKRNFEYDMFVRQYYPIKVTNKETGSKIQRSPAVEETSRTVMSDGTVIKIMPDGSTQVLKNIFSQLVSTKKIQVLCLDGSVHSNQGTSGVFNEGLTMPRSECSSHPNHNHIITTAPPSTLIDRRKSEQFLHFFTLLIFVQSAHNSDESKANRTTNLP